MPGDHYYKSAILVYGTRLNLESYALNVLNDFEHDFGYFLTDSPNPNQDIIDHEKTFIIQVQPLQEKPKFPKPWLNTKRSQLFHGRGWTNRVCLFGDTYVNYDFNRRVAEIYSDNAMKAYEAVYFITLSFLGESFDISGIHRIHGFGFQNQGVSGIMLAPSGGGKSTLALQLLERGRTQMLSDDTPLITNQSRMLAFPQRIALKSPPGSLLKYCRKFKRVAHGEKFVIGSDYFSSKIVEEAKVTWLLISSKKKVSKASIKEVSRIRAVWPVLKWLVIGYETPQIWEFYLRPSLRDVYIKAKIFLSRISVGAKLIFRGRIAIFKLESDVVKSANVFEQFFLENPREKA